MKKKNNRNKKSGKVLVNIAILVLVFSIMGILTSFNFADKNIDTSTVIVQEQQTLWSIAKNICDDDNNLNVRNVISDIKDINGLSTSNIYIGQELKIPVY